ncbi:MAG: aldehyde dehydrogenase family protein [Candidatus Acetothermia bacterium]
MITIRVTPSITSTNPATGTSTEYRVPDPEEIDRAVRDAGEAFEIWKGCSPEERGEYLSRIRRVMVEDLDWIVDGITEDTAKVDVEALMADVLPPINIVGNTRKKDLGSWVEKGGSRNFTLERPNPT